MSTDPPNRLRTLEPPRELRANEREIIEQLLEQPFLGRDAIRSQLSMARVRAEAGDGTRTIRFELAATAPTASTALRVPVEAEAADADGVPIEVLLHVVDGLAQELEIYRVDGRDIKDGNVASLHAISVNEAQQADKTSAALLELGLEDRIPIPEALVTPEVRESVEEEDLVQKVSESLAALVANGQLRLYRGRWDSDPLPLSPVEAVELLRDPRWYSFRTDDPSEERLYFVNVDNIRES